MIAPGIFAKTFPRPTVEAVFDEVASLQLNYIQFNFTCAGLPLLPEAIPTKLASQIKSEAAKRNITISAVSATFNLIDPNVEQRDQNIQRLGILGGACESLGISILTMSTGTRTPHDMWRRHPDNDSSSAWSEMVEGLRLALWITEPFGVTLAVEPEPGNVMSDIWKARRLLDEIASPRLKILFDAANILDGMPQLAPVEALTEAFRIAGQDIALAHGKEWVEEGTAEKVPGRGKLDWRLYLDLLLRSYQGPLILHGFEEAHAREAVGFVRQISAQHTTE